MACGPRDDWKPPLVYWWPPPIEMKWIAEFFIEATDSLEEFPEGVSVDWPPVAVETKLPPSWPNHMLVGGPTDWRLVGCWRRFHITVRRGDSIIYTIGCRVNTDVACTESDPAKLDFIAEYLGNGTSPLAARAFELYDGLDCDPDEPLVLITVPGAKEKNTYWHRSCDGNIVVEPSH